MYQRLIVHLILATPAMPFSPGVPARPGTQPWLALKHFLLLAPKPRWPVALSLLMGQEMLALVLQTPEEFDAASMQLSRQQASISYHLIFVISSFYSVFLTTFLVQGGT